jgi:hypothetical protein
LLSLIINYIIRGSIAVIGVLLLTGIIGVDTPEGTTLKIMGAIMIVWGIYRTISFYRSYKKMNLSEEDSDE